MTRYLARLVLVAFIVILVSVPVALFFGRSSTPTHEAVVWIDMAPPLDVLGERPTISNDTFVADQMAFLGSELVLEPALHLVNPDDLFRVDPDDELRSIRERIYYSRIGRGYIRIAVRGAEKEMPACRMLANAVVEEYLRLRGDREAMKRNSVMVVLQRLRDQQREELTNLMRHIESTDRQLASTGQENGAHADNGHNATTKAELAFLKLDLDDTMSTLASVTRRLHRLALDGDVSHVSLMVPARIERIDAQSDSAKCLARPAY